MTRYRLIIFFEIILLLILVSGKFLDIQRESATSDKIQIEEQTISAENETKDFIKWVDFTVSCEALELASELDIKAHEEGKELDWIRLLSYAAAKNGGEFGKNSLKDMSKIADEAMEKCGKKTPSAWLDVTAANLKYYEYYKEAYGAVLSGMLGSYRIQEENSIGQIEWVDKYGIKAFSPIAKRFDYSDYDDFGSSRSYGYSRPHLGHDMMGQVGTPIIAIESGTIEALGWNQYGGWRIGIRSFDKKRYYYYAHLRQNYPYFTGLEEGDTVTAGQVIGYMGHTGYSTKENVNNIKTVHLHWGMQLIFDESQKDSDNEIWIDCYQLSQFLRKHRSEVEKVEGTKDWKWVYEVETE